MKAHLTSSLLTDCSGIRSKTLSAEKLISSIFWNILDQDGVPAKISIFDAPPVWNVVSVPENRVVASISAPPVVISGLNSPIDLSKIP